MSLHMHGCHTNTDISVCSIHVQLPACMFFNLCVYVSIYCSPLPSESSWLQYDTPRVAESQKGSWEGMRTESQSGWRLASTDLLLSLFSFSPHPASPPLILVCFPYSLSLSRSLSFSFSVSLSPSFCPVFVSAHPCPFICPLFLFLPLMCVGNKSVCMCVTDGVTCDQAGSVAAWSHRISAYRTKFHLH